MDGGCLSSLGLSALSRWLSSTTALLTGRYITVGPLRLVPLRQLGEGGFAVVLLCADSATGDQYAVKRSVAREPEQVAQAEQESALLARLQHPNIVRFIGAETQPEAGSRTTLYLVMEYCATPVLRSMRQRHDENRRFTETEVFRMVRDLALAVAHLHGQDPPIAHRDVKVDNLLTAADGRYKLCDFGSCVAHAYEPQGTREINLLQEEIERHTTLQYRAPELCDLFAKTRLDEKVDDWAMGCVLYYLCFFDLPFGESKLQILNGKWTIPAAGCAEGFRTILTHCLNPHPAQRWDIWAVLEALHGMDPSGWHPPARPDPLVPQPLFRFQA